MDKTEAVIIEVQKNPILYDKAERDYKDVTKKRENTMDNLFRALTLVSFSSSVVLRTHTVL